MNQANVGWRDGYLGSENNWGSLPTARTSSTTSRFLIRASTISPTGLGPTDVYQVQQNASYDLNDIDRTRINGQAVLQFRPMDNLTGTLDYTYSQNTVEVRNSNVGVWFNFNDVSSAWTEARSPGRFSIRSISRRRAAPTLRYKTCKYVYSGSLTANRSINKSLGGNLAWDAFDRLHLELDAHHSTAELKPNNKYGTNMSVGNAVFGIADQTINYENDLPVISVDHAPGDRRARPGQHHADRKRIPNRLQSRTGSTRAS